jgi:acyl CoA:acetate/3-ketoacid CoA transferase alpha subunit
MNNVLASAAGAVVLGSDGATPMMGGFGPCGIPENVIKALHTEMAVTAVTPGGLVLEDVASDTTVEAVRRVTAADLRVEGEPARF